MPVISFQHANTRIHALAQAWQLLLGEEERFGSLARAASMKMTPESDECAMFEKVFDVLWKVTLYEYFPEAYAQQNAALTQVQQECTLDVTTYIPSV